jgi:hypothetical protein
VIRRAAALGSVGLLLACLLTACSGLTGQCDLTVAVIDDVGAVAIGDALPPDAPILATPLDVDSSLGYMTTDMAGNPSVAIRFRPEAAMRLEAHTTDNVGGALGLVVGGKVVAVPLIMGAIGGGELMLTDAMQGPKLAPLLAGCATGPDPNR